MYLLYNININQKDIGDDISDRMELDDRGLWRVFVKTESGSLIAYCASRMRADAHTIDSVEEIRSQESFIILTITCHVL